MAGGHISDEDSSMDEDSEWDEEESDEETSDEESDENDSLKYMFTTTRHNVHTKENWAFADRVKRGIGRGVREQRGMVSDDTDRVGMKPDSTDIFNRNMEFLTDEERREREAEEEAMRWWRENKEAVVKRATRGNRMGKICEICKCNTGHTRQGCEKHRRESKKVLGNKRLSIEIKDIKTMDDVINNKRQRVDEPDEMAMASITDDLTMGEEDWEVMSTAIQQVDAENHENTSKGEIALRTEVHHREPEIQTIHDESTEIPENTCPMYEGREASIVDGEFCGFITNKGNYMVYKRGLQRVCRLCKQKGHDLVDHMNKDMDYIGIAKEIQKIMEKKMMRALGNQALRPRGKAWENYQKPIKERCFRADVNEKWIKEMRDNIWIADTGASTHMTRIKEGFTQIREENTKMTFAVPTTKGNSSAQYIGTWKGREYVLNREEKRMKPGLQLILRDTLYVPGLVSNLFSVNKAREEGATIFERDGFLGLKMENEEIIFNIPLRSKFGYVLGAYIKPVGIEAERITVQQTSIDINKYHAMLGHPGEEYVRSTAKSLDVKLTGKFKKCEACAKGKAQRTPVSNLPMMEESRPRERYGMDISSSNSISIGGRRYWVIWIDYGTNYIWSMFLKEKSELVDRGIQFLRERAREYKGRMFVRCDNAGENRALADAIGEIGMNVQFEFTAPGTPQQNGKAERAFATIWGKMRSCMIHAGFTQKMKENLFAEVINTLTCLHNVQCDKRSEESPHLKSYGCQPKWAKKLRTIGEIGIVKGLGRTGKLESRGRGCIMVGYQNMGQERSYRMYNLETRRLLISRNVTWLNQLYGEYAQKIKTGDSDDEESGTVILEIPKEEVVPGEVMIREDNAEEAENGSDGEEIPNHRAWKIDFQYQDKEKKMNYTRTSE